MAVDYNGLATLVAAITAAVTSILAALRSSKVEKKVDQASVERQLIARDIKDSM